MRRCHIDELLCEVEHIPSHSSAPTLCVAVLLFFYTMFMHLCVSAVWARRTIRVTLNTGWVKLIQRSVWLCAIRLRRFGVGMCSMLSTRFTQHWHRTQETCRPTKCNTILILHSKLNLWNELLRTITIKTYSHFSRCAPFWQCNFDDCSFSFFWILNSKNVVWLAECYENKCTFQFDLFPSNTGINL